jgi:hypothetical protein
MRYLPAIIVFGAAGAGYFYTHEEEAKSLSPTIWEAAKNFSPASWISDESEDEVLRDGAAGDERSGAILEDSAAVQAPPVADYSEVFRFDISPRWVADRWPRVSTGLSDVRYQAYRVPLVTGTEATDVAGSLTYYFDGTPRVRRIAFVGTTADPSRLIDFLARGYGFKKTRPPSPRVTTYGVRYRWTGNLQITPAEFLDRNLAATNYRVDLVIER